MMSNLRVRSLPKVKLHKPVDPADGESMLLRNVSIYVQVHTALLPRRPTSAEKRRFHLALGCANDVGSNLVAKLPIAGS
jgi:hypothetical protein